MSLRLRERLPRVSAALLFAGLLVHAQTAQDPPCYNNRPAPAHYRTETGPDGSVLRVVGVWVDPAVDTGNFTRGVDLAMSNWNNVNNLWGVDIPYRFERVSDPAQAGISITGGGETACTSACACYNPNTQTINTTAASRDNTPGEIASTIAHEIGHPLGLGNSTNRSSAGVSIMQGYYGDCLGITDGPQPTDVHQVNRHSTNRSTCELTERGSDHLNQQCLDADGDGVTTCDGDCNDSLFDPSNRCTGQYCPDQQYPCQMDEWWDEYQCACVCNPVYCTPILVDTRGDGFRLTSAADGALKIPLDFDGRAEYRGARIPHQPTTA
jgi:hypothetical protein